VEEIGKFKDKPVSRHLPHGARPGAARAAQQAGFTQVYACAAASDPRVAAGEPARGEMTDGER
jgi:hypothetical protein